MKLGSNPVLMSIHPEYAEKIYSWKKTWEFRKNPPPLFQVVYLYETAPVSAITGLVVFTAGIRGGIDFILDNTQNRERGVSENALRRYAGDGLISALRVGVSYKLEKPVHIRCRPPQNWMYYGQ